MDLVKTKDYKGNTKTCLINHSQNNGEFTACSIACDSSIETEGVEWTLNKPAKKPTCEDCIEAIKWWKSIKI